MSAKSGIAVVHMTVKCNVKNIGACSQVGLRLRYLKNGRPVFVGIEGSMRAMMNFFFLVFIIYGDTVYFRKS